MKILSIVCARAGSKGLENKCMTRIDGRMVVEYAIDYSLSLGANVKTVVSTDIEGLIVYCKRHDLECIRRDSALCTDESRISDALGDAIEKQLKIFDYCSLVYGNIPTRYPKLFQEAVEFLDLHEDYDAAISMQNVEKFHPEWMFELNDEILPRSAQLDYRRQKLPQKMIHDGHTLIFKRDIFYKRYKGQEVYEDSCIYSIFGDRIKPMINHEVIIDIDTKKDLDLAEAFVASSRGKRQC